MVVSHTRKMPEMSGICIFLFDSFGHLVILISRPPKPEAYSGVVGVILLSYIGLATELSCYPTLV